MLELELTPQKTWKEPEKWCSLVLVFMIKIAFRFYFGGKEIQEKHNEKQK